jgi:hypothetical protein
MRPGIRYCATSAGRVACSTAGAENLRLKLQVRSGAQIATWVTEQWLRSKSS